MLEMLLERGNQTAGILVQGFFDPDTGAVQVELRDDQRPDAVLVIPCEQGDFMECYQHPFAHESDGVWCELVEPENVD